MQNGKKEVFGGVLIHTTVFLIFSLILLWDKLDKVWFRFPGWFCLGLLYLLHLVEDEYRAYNVRHTHKEDSFGFFLWDQFVHIMFIFLFSPTENFVFEPLIIILCIFILGTHFLSVIIFYIENELYGIDVSIGNFNQKYYYIVLRLGVLLLFLLPGRWFLLSFLMLPVMFYIFKRKNNLSYLGFWISSACVYLLGFLILVVKS